MRHAKLRHALVDVFHQVAAFKQSAGQVDGNGVVKAEAVLPLARLPCGLAQRPFRQGHDQACVFGQRNELAWRHQLAAALPAHQRFGTHHAGSSHVNLGLVVQHQFVTFNGAVQCGFQLQLFAAAASQLRAVDAGAVAPLGLDGVHGHVGIAQQVHHGVAIARVDGHADTGRDKAFLAAHEDGLAQRLQHALRNALGVAVISHLGQQSHKLVAAQPTHGFQRAVRPHAGRFQCAFHDLVAVAHAGTQAAAHLHQQFVTGTVAQGVVDGLEAVQVDQQQRKLMLHAARLLQRLLCSPDQLAAVGQAGE